MSALACGHAPSPHGEHTTGTAHMPDRREVCWECADAHQRERMRTESEIVAYLNTDGSQVTTWSGGTLGTVTRRVTRRVGFHGSTRHYLTVCDTDGRMWHGTSPGPDMYARLHASKLVRS